MSYEANEIRPGSARRIPTRWRSIGVIVIVAASASIWAIQPQTSGGATIESAPMSAVAERWNGLAEFHQAQAEAASRASAAETERLTRHAESIMGQRLDGAQAAYAARLQAAADAALADG